MVFVTFFSLFSFSDIDTAGFNIPHLDKAVHFTFYFGMVFLAFLAFKEFMVSDDKFKRYVLVILVFAVSYGIFIEVLQYKFTTTRQGDFLDAFANSIGAVLGMWTVRHLFFRKYSLK